MGKKVIFVGLVVLMLAAAAAAGNSWILFLFNGASRSGGIGSAVGADSIDYEDSGETWGPGFHVEGWAAKGQARSFATASGIGGQSSVEQGNLITAETEKDSDSLSSEMVVAAGQSIETSDGLGSATGVNGAGVEQSQGDATLFSHYSGQSQTATIVQSGSVSSLGGEAAVTQGGLVYSSQTSQLPDDE